MYVHFEQKVALVLPPKVASRMQAETAKTRGFLPVGGHHSGPFDQSSRNMKSWDARWWEADQGAFRYVTTVRNHFDRLSTWFAGWVRIQRNPKPEKVCIAFLEEWPVGQPKFFLARNRLFRFVWELPDPVILRYESIREDFDGMLRRFGFGPLEPWEFPWNPAHKTSGKPTDWWNYWEEDAIRWVEDVMGEELEALGYSFPYDRLGKSHEEVFGG